MVGLGFPLSLSLQLQESDLRLDQAIWTAKSTKGGFSVSLFWPAPDCKSEAQQRRRKRKRKPKTTSKLVPATHSLMDPNHLLRLPEQPLPLKLMKFQLVPTITLLFPSVPAVVSSYTVTRSAI